MIENILFLNPWEGLGFMMKKKLESESIDINWKNSKDHVDDFKKFKIKSTPVLVILDNSVECDRIYSTEEILKKLKKNA